MVNTERVGNAFNCGTSFMKMCASLNGIGVHSKFLYVLAQSNYDKQLAISSESN